MMKKIFLKIKILFKLFKFFKYKKNYKLKIKKLNLEEFNQLLEESKENDYKLFRDNPDMKMPVFVSRNNPKYKIKF